MNPGKIQVARNYLAISHLYIAMVISGSTRATQVTFTGGRRELISFRMDNQGQIRSLKGHYRSGKSDLAKDFFAPCLSLCTKYQRAAAYFTSSALVTWAAALPSLARNSEKQIQLLIAPILPLQDLQALEGVAGPEARDHFLSEIGDKFVLDALSFSEQPNDVGLRLRLFAWMVASRRLELRFAFPEHVEDPGIFHEKIGIFTFPWGDEVAFTGSANESHSGHRRNYETLDVYRSWESADQERINVKQEQFREAWEGVAEGLDVRCLSDKVLERIQAIAPRRNPLEDTEVEHEDEPPAIEVRRWRHQEEAIQIFLEKKNGILEMATGTGKTRTALAICRRLESAGDVKTIIIAADGVDLLDQWYAQLLREVRRLKTRFSIHRHYEAHHERERFALQPSASILLIRREKLPSVLSRLPREHASRTLLIHDEVHQLGSYGNRTALDGLSEAISYRLGLSATPEREYDEQGTAFIERHIGPVIYTFSLEDAIRRGVLSPFAYHSLEYRQSAEDREKTEKVYKQVSARKHSGNPMPQEEIWVALARVHKESRAKLPIFEDFIAQHQDLLTRCIVFVETMEYGAEVLEILHRYRHDFHTYYSDDDSSTLRKFADGDLECLITCHRLSEGIDIRSLRTVILFSSARARLETIQRMGRCLRIDPADPLKRANVLDFIRQPDEHGAATSDQERKNWLIGLSEIQPEE